MTVKVPDPLVPVFHKAQEYVRRYFGRREEQPGRGTITIAGERYILLRAASMSAEFFDLVTSAFAESGDEAGRRFARDLLFDVAHGIGKADARSFRERMGVADPVQLLSAGPVHFAHSGWAFVNILAESSPTPDESFFLLYDHAFSFEAEAWSRRGKQSDAPVCVMSSGYSSGWCEESFGLPLVAAEIECQAAGGSRCRFVMAPPARIEAHLSRLSLTRPAGTRVGRVQVPEFLARKRVEDELRRHQEELETRVEQRTAELSQANDLLRREIADRRRTEQRLRLLGSAVQNAEEGIIILGSLGEPGEPRISFANVGFSRLTGLSEAEATGETLSVLGVPEEDRPVLDALRQHLVLGRPFRGEMTARRADGTEYGLEIHAMPVDEPGEPASQAIAILRDVSERRHQLARLEHQALYDALTDLPNRILFHDRVEQALLGASRKRSSLALLFLDLDGFKDVNDTFGHQGGDQLLKQVGVRLASQLRATDSVSRVGGDEFAVLLPFLEDTASATLAAEKILKGLREPFFVDGQPVTVGASIGIALSPEHGAAASTLLRRADVAMYVAKQTGGGYAVYEPEQDRVGAGRLTQVAELRQAVERGQLRVHYLPVVELPGRRVRAVEGLVRWEHPRNGLLLPDRFLSLVERSGLAGAVTEKVLELALSDLAGMRGAGYTIGLSLNLFARNLSDPAFVDVLTGLLRDYGADSECLTLELTESVLQGDPPVALGAMRQLRSRGVRFSLDDFGTGYSSLARLRELPVDEIKIDRSFVRQMGENAGDAAIVRSVVDLARSLGRHVVAEGVESQECLDHLLALGCGSVQGYFLSPPLPAADLRPWLGASLAAGAAGR